jgi:alpha-beta hydrolase superfamily lysophospholipase
LLLLLGVIAACAPRLQTIGPDVDRPALTPTHIHTADGTDLPLRAWLPKDGSGQVKPIKGVIVALHGFNDYSKGLEIPGSGLARRGYAVYAYDQRGFGQTPQRGIWAGEDRMIADLRLAVALLREAHPGLPVFVLGESMGAAVAMAASVRDPPLLVDGMVLVSPATWGRATLSPFYREVLEMSAHSVPWMTVLLTTVSVQASNNRAALRALSRDPLVIKATRVDAAYGLVNLMSRAYDSVPDICDTGRAMPRCLIMYGGREDILAKGAVAMTLRQLPERPPDQLRLVLYQNGHHLLLRDLGSYRVFDDIAAWLADPTQPLPSGEEALVTELPAGN